MNILEQRVLQLIGENTDSPDIYVDTDEGLKPIRESLNDAIEEIVMVTGSYKRKYYIPLIENQIFYRFNFSKGSLGWITDVWINNQKRRLQQKDLTYLRNYDPRWMISTGTPIYYFPIGSDVIGFWRTPSASSDIAEVTCVVIPERYETSEDRIKLRRDFEWAAVHYAVSEWWASRGDANEAKSHFQKYLDLLGLSEMYPESRERSYSYKTTKELT